MTTKMPQRRLPACCRQDVCATFSYRWVSIRAWQIPLQWQFWVAERILELDVVVLTTWDRHFTFDQFAHEFGHSEVKIAGKLIMMKQNSHKVRWLSRRLPKPASKRLVVLTGARQTGKTTLARQVYPELRYLNFEALENREFVRGLRAMSWGKSLGDAILDEAQKEPAVSRLARRPRGDPRCANRSTRCRKQNLVCAGASSARHLRKRTAGMLMLAQVTGHARRLFSKRCSPLYRKKVPAE
ncbi:MAG: AAA family ATPase [candidate division KSB1 bacterium]|nr:AAA family ATPase [candidate division KSB1 bacterium]MDZ7272761.1 AAA family ATPase [candidate division KSB1 bacterium]MDZ7284215.1 AAA family ATPase [candidate division KSB1 bacterium]MDZ7297387.1 AAA family ATPase [candidate division KSB1 bacterium]MDZ7309629.1 AAA family ATPase [candidate division KSB1 bacterium]